MPKDTTTHAPNCNCNACFRAYYAEDDMPPKPPTPPDAGLDAPKCGCGYCRMDRGERIAHVALEDRLRQLQAHRACHSAEHDPANGKIHGYCVVCGVPWPCGYAGTPPPDARTLHDPDEAWLADAGGEKWKCHKCCNLRWAGDPFAAICPNGGVCEPGRPDHAVNCPALAAWDIPDACNCGGKYREPDRPDAGTEKARLIEDEAAILEHEAWVKAARNAQQPLEGPISLEDRLRQLSALTREFVDYWTTDRTPVNQALGCGMCGGIPHSSTCYVGRFDALLSERPTP